MSRYAPCPQCGNARERGTRCNHCGDSPAGSGAREALAAFVLVALAMCAFAFWKSGGLDQIRLPAPLRDLVAAPTPPAPPAEEVATPPPASVTPPESPAPLATGTPAGPIGMAPANPGDSRDPNPPPAPPAPGLEAAAPTASARPVVRKETALPPTTLGIQAKEIGTGSASEITWRNDYGSSSKNFYRTKGIQLTVTNVSGSPARDVKAMAVWFGKSLSTNTLLVSHAESISFDVGGTATVERSFYCPILFANVTTYVTLNQRSVEGSKFFGWAVLLMKDGEVVAGRGSGDQINSMIRQEQPIKALLAAYRPDGRAATVEMPHWRHDPIRYSRGPSTPKSEAP